MTLNDPSSHFKVPPFFDAEAWMSQKQLLLLLLLIINVKNFHESLTIVKRAQNDTSKTAMSTDTIFNKKKW